MPPMGRSREHLRRFTGSLLSRRGGFRSEYIDFDRGIRVGHLEPQERITQLIKARLTERHGARMICDRWGRGVHWQWICWVPEPNRNAKPISSGYNFAAAKFFVAVEREDRVFQAGMQVERAPARANADDWGVRIEKDWDWHVLLRALRAAELPRRVSALIREGFRVRVGPFEALEDLDRKSWSAAACLRAARRKAAREWGGFQLFWPLSEEEVKATPGADLIDAIAAAFDEVVPVMNLCMQVPCLRPRAADAGSRCGAAAKRT